MCGRIALAFSFALLLRAGKITSSSFCLKITGMYNHFTSPDKSLCPPHNVIQVVVARYRDLQMGGGGGGGGGGGAGIVNYRHD